MALLDALLGKKDKTVTDVTVEPTATIEKEVTSAVESKPSNISLATAITGETEAVIYSED
jgi:hypothetical protein